MPVSAKGKQISVVLLAISCLLQFSISVFLPKVYGDDSEFSFQDQSSFLDESKIYHVYANVANRSTQPLKNIVVTAKFFDSRGANLGEYNASTALNGVNPGEKSPAEILFLDAANSNRIANYTLTATGTVGDKLEPKIKIISANSRLDLLGTFYINAVAVNQATEPANNSLAVAALYDKDNRLIAIGRALAEAVPGSPDIPAGATAPFGIAVNDKLQTYKVAHYTLIVQSDISQSDIINVDAHSSGYNSPNPSQIPVSRCIIATAAFGSDIAPEVQTLRMFRDDVALHTFSGSSFMTVFNLWYYSFSPSIATYERGEPWLQAAVRFSIEPLLGILNESKQIDGYLLKMTTSDSAIIISGIVAAFLIGMVYLFPIAGVITLITRKYKTLQFRNPMRFLLVAWLAGIGSTIAGLFAFGFLTEMIGTSLIVLSSLASAVIIPIWMVRR